MMMLSSLPSKLEPALELPHTQALVTSIDRSATSLVDTLCKLIEQGAPLESAMTWLGRSRDARRGLLMQKAVAAAIACSHRYKVDEEVSLPLIEAAGRQRTIKIDMLITDMLSGATAAWEITHTTRTPSPRVWADRARLIKNLLQHHYGSRRLAAHQVTVLTGETQPVLDEAIGAKIMTLRDAAAELDVPILWAVKAAAKRFDNRVAQEMADAGL